MRQTLLLLLLAVLVSQARAQEAPPYLAEAAFDSEWVYIGQAVTYTVTAYSDTARDVTFKMPVFEGFWQADGRAFEGSATLDGKQYNTAVYQVRLYPQQIGRLAVGAAKVEFEETVFSAGTFELSNPASIEVMELPSEPDGFSGMVGVVAAEFSADLSVAGLGEPVTIALTLRGSANLAQLDRPGLIAPDGWRIYDEPGLATSEIDDNLLVQTRIMRWRAIPDRAGRAQLGVPPVIFFDPADGYVTLDIPSVGLEVLPGPNGELSREAQTQISESLFVPAPPQGAAGAVPAWAWFLAPLILAGVIAGQAGLQRWRQMRAEGRKRNALKRASARLRQAARNADGLSQIEAAVRDYFMDHGWAIADTPEVRGLLIAVEGERYHPQGAERSAVLAKKAGEMLRRIEAKNERP